jgi:hypothetical protein
MERRQRRPGRNRDRRRPRRVAAAIGVLGGTVFFAGLVGAKLDSARLTRAVGAGAGARLSCATALAGNLVITVSPWFAGVALGRLATGFSLGLALVLGPVLARRAGGVRMVGLFGGAVTLGTAAGLGAGSLLRAAGVDWRIDFALAAAVAGGALVTLRTAADVEVSSGSVIRLARSTARSLPAWRLELLFMTSLGLPYVLGLWASRSSPRTWGSPPHSPEPSAFSSMRSAP